MLAFEEKLFLRLLILIPATKLINCGAEITVEISLQAARASFGFTARIIRFLVVVNLLSSADLMPY
jgi:hypothetical protein